MQSTSMDDEEKTIRAVERFPAIVISGGTKRDIEVEVTQECKLTVMLNNQELTTLFCTPTDPEYLALGFLWSEGLLAHKNDLKNISVDFGRGLVLVETVSGKAMGPPTLNEQSDLTFGYGRVSAFHELNPSGPNITSTTRVPASDILAAAEAFQHLSPLYQATHGAHSAALCSGGQIMVWAEDIGRHNAVDKVLGHCFLKDIPTHGRSIFSSGRIASDMVLKALKAGAPIIVSVAVPTSQAIKLARHHGITIIGAVKNRQMTIFTHEERVET